MNNVHPIERSSQHAATLDEAADRELERMHRAKDAMAANECLSGAPEPLRRPTPPPTPYPIAELGPIIRPACEAIRRVIQAPDAVCAASLLAAASLATQGLADIHIDGRTHPLTLWFLTIAESGERKSAVDHEAMRGAQEVERESHRAYQIAAAAHNDAMDAWTARRKEAQKKASRRNPDERETEPLLSFDPAPTPPLLPSLVVADFTAEGIAKLLRDGRASVGAFTDEAGLVFGGHGMTKETETRTAATLSKLWDRGELDRIRAGEGALKLWGRRMAMHLMAQPVIAERALSNEVLAGQGFLPRCLLAWPNGTAGTRRYVAENLEDDAAVMQLAARTFDLLRRPLPLSEGSRNELEPRALVLDADAKKAWVAFHDEIEIERAPNGHFAICSASASKTPEQCVRIAGVLTLLEEPDAQQINVFTLRRAAVIARWHLNEAVRLVGTAELSPETRNAEALLNWCHETDRTLLYSSVALQRGPARVRERTTFMDAALVLEKAGWARKIEGGREIDGKHRRHVWQIAPATSEPESSP